MQKALRFLTRNAEIVVGLSLAYIVTMLFFTETFGEYSAVIWPALVVGLGAAFLIALKSEAEIQKARI